MFQGASNFVEYNGEAVANKSPSSFLRTESFTAMLSAEGKSGISASVRAEPGFSGERRAEKGALVRNGETVAMNVFRRWSRLASVSRVGVERDSEILSRREEGRFPFVPVPSSEAGGRKCVNTVNAVAEIDANPCDKWLRRCLRGSMRIPGT